MRAMTAVFAGVFAVVAAGAGGGAAVAWPGPHVTVAADGSGDFTTVQAAVDAVPAGNASTFTIKIKPGVYHGQVIVPATKPYVFFRGQGADPTQVVIVDDRANGTPKPDGGTWGTSGSASVTIDGHDFQARNLTFANSFDEAAHPEISGKQAVAVLTRADRLVFDNVRFLGNQDTLYVNSPDAATPARVYLRKCYVEGDVDFIFGRATAVFDRCRIHSLDRGSTTNNGYVTAASTSIANPYGLLFTHCTFTGDAPAGTVYLGRPWHPSQDPNAIAQTLIRESTLGAHVIAAAPWTDFGTWSWRDARYAEYRNRGAGAVPSADRPQLTAAEAATLTPRTYLSGVDGWHPER
ncbi:pectinesterase family protein [Phytohabitans rumicis]|uniref:Pectinesterase n=1 Tax=Phytohabitans rumicis TaxID=1076125 RepID=A0A6V8LH30_9ACTN|nr:pectinesterase family protein [Phytohabitans rumicis]GFJ94950.1 pectinesterase [Phytohabitans rumicis]